MTATTIPIPDSVEEIIWADVLPKTRRGEILITPNEFDALTAKVQKELGRLELPQGIGGLDARDLTHKLLIVQRPNFPGYTYDPEIGYVLTQ